MRVKRPGLRAIHPSRYVFRSPAKKRESLLRAAWVAPEMFQSPVVRAHLFPLRPESRKRWDALLAVRFPVSLDGGDGPVVREFGATLRQGPAIAHRFDRRVSLTPKRPGTSSTPEVTFLEPVTLGPGPYTLTTVVADPAGGAPQTDRIVFEVPPIPRKEAFVVEPILGRPAGGDLVIRGQAFGPDRVGGEDSFLPLLVRSMDAGPNLVALTQTCWVGGKRGPRGRWTAEAEVLRTLTRDAHGPVGELPPAPLALEGSGRVRCQNVLDVLPVERLPEGTYTFEATLDRPGDGRAPARSLGFALAPATAGEDAEDPGGDEGSAERP